jgi:hypothetical protein
MEISQFKKLLNSEEYLAFEQYIQTEITKAERKAIASIHTEEIDKENANRAKFYSEILSIPRNKISAWEMGKWKTKV